MPRPPAIKIEAIETLIRSLPTNIVAAIRINDFNKAQSLAAEATQQSPQWAEAWVADGMASARLEQFDRAQQAYERALSLYQAKSRENPSDANSVFQQIYLLTLLNWSDEAKTKLEQARKKYPDDNQLATLSEHFSEVKSGLTNWMVKKERRSE